MSALTRCARYARVFNRSPHKFTRNVANQCTSQGRHLNEIHSKHFCTSKELLKRFYTVSTSVPSADAEVNSPSEIRAPKTPDSLTEDSQKSTYFERIGRLAKDSPTSQYWKNVTFEHKDDNFATACQEMYNTLVTGEELRARHFYNFMRIVQKRETFIEDELTLILKTVGYLNKVISKQEKLEWTEYLTKRFKSLGVPLQVTYYNRVLRNYLTCDIPFSPVEFMSLMEKEGVAPNEAMFGRFLEAYCKVGDMHSASKLLEHMRAHNMVLTTRAYSRLILGNFIAGDKETAMKLFRDSSEMGFEGALFYHPVVLGHALMGDLNGVKKMLEEADENMVRLSDGSYSKILEQVAPTGHQEIFDFLLQRLTEQTTTYFNEAADTLTVLFEQGNYKNAYQYFRGLTDPSALFLYKFAVRANMDTKQVLEFVKMMKADNISEANLLQYVGVAIANERLDSAIATLPYFDQLDEAFRPHLLPPLAMYCRIMRDFEGLKKVMAMLDDNCGGEVLFFADFLTHFNLSLDEYKDAFRKSKLSPEQVNACVLLRLKSWEEAANYAKRCGPIHDIDSRKKSILKEVFSHFTEPDLEYVIEVMSACQYRGDFVDKHIIDRLLNLKVDEDKLKKLLLEKKVLFGERALTNKQFKGMFSEQELQKIQRRALDSNALKNMTMKELLNISPGYAESFIYKIAMLDRSFKAQRLDLYRKTYNSMNEKMKSDLYGLQQIFATKFCLLEGDIEGALKHLKYLKNKENFIPESKNVMSIANQLCEAGKYQEAEDLLRSYNYHHKEEPFEHLPYKSGFFSLEPTTENYAVATRLLKAIEEGGFFTNRKYSVFLKLYWQFVANIDDLEMVFDAFDHLRTNMKWIPHDYSVVFTRLIRSADRVGLQTAYDLFTEHENEQKVLLSLVAAFLEVGQIENAKKTLASPGMRIFKTTAMNICHRFGSEDKMDLLKEFTSLIKDIPGDVSKNDWDVIMLQVLCNRENPDIDAVIKYFDENVGESAEDENPKACAVYANFLNYYNRPVPLDKFTLNYIQNGKMDTNEEVNKERIPEQKVKETKKVLETTTSQKVIMLHNFISKKQIRNAKKLLSEMSEEDLKKLLNENSSQRTNVVNFLLDFNLINILQSIPEDKLQKLLTEQIKHKEENWSPMRWTCYLELQKDLVVQYLPKLELNEKKTVFFASLFKNDKEVTNAIKKSISESDDKAFIGDAVFKRERRPELYLAMIDACDSNELKAKATALAIEHVAAWNKESAEKLVEQLTSYGLELETLADLVPSDLKEQYNLNIGEIKEKIGAKSNKKPKKQKSKKDSKESVGTSELSTDKAVTDIATEVYDKTEVTVATEIHEELSVAEEKHEDVTIAKPAKTEVLSINKDSETIVDNAKTIKPEADTEDKAEVITDSQCGSIDNTVDKKTT